jgi:hypothetical protein
LVPIGATSYLAYVYAYSIVGVWSQIVMATSGSLDP